jgi:tetratricopeptide (TPR) repeat protein
MTRDQVMSAKAIVESALGLARAGRLDDAATLCRDRLAREPDDVNVLGVLGAVLLKARDYDAARACLIRATELEPEFAKPFEDLGALYLATGRAAEAVTCLERATALEPGQPAAFFGLSTALERSGRHREAEMARSRFLELSPGGRKLSEAARHRLAGETERAERICGEILAKEPRNIHALRLVARISADRRRDGAAEGLLRRIMSLAPEFLPAYTDLAQLFAERSRFVEAAAMLRQASAIRPDDAGLQLALGDMLSIVGRSAQALAAYRKVLELQPDHVRALLGSAHMLRIEGDRAEAIAAYRRCIELDPEVGDAWWYLASMRGVTLTDAELQALQEQLDAADGESDSAIALHFAIARGCESQGNFERAWQHYVSGNRAKRRTVVYDPVELEMQHDARIRVFDAQLLDRAGEAPENRKVRPVFITGMPRSGSTLIEQILASHSAVQGCGELPYVIMLTAKLGRGGERGKQYPDIVPELSHAEWLALGDEYLAHSRAHHAADIEYFADKMPANFAHLGFIRLMLPEAVFIDARRNPLDTCVANYRQLFAQGKNQSYDLTELGEYYLEYLRIMRHWEQVMPGCVLTVQYEEVVADLEEQVRRLLAHCGLPFEENCLRFYESDRRVNTASAEQVREPIYRDAIAYWKRYESQLEELKQILMPATDLV